MPQRPLVASWGLASPFCISVLNSDKRERVREVCLGKGRPYTLVYSLASLWRANGP